LIILLLPLLDDPTASLLFFLLAAHQSLIGPFTNHMHSCHQLELCDRFLAPYSINALALKLEITSQTFLVASCRTGAEI
jgi:hypothetical protein